MSNYTKTTNFSAKDALATGNPSKIITGTGIDTEFNNIATAVTTKADITSATLVTPNIGVASGTSLTLTSTLAVTGAITATGGVVGNCSTVTIADAGGDTTTFPLLGTSATGSLAPATDAGLTYNATTNALTTTTFIGALTGNADTTTNTVSKTGTGSTYVTNTSPTLAAGTASDPAFKLTSGTNLTVAAAGAAEYDGTVFYATPVASNRGALTSEHFCMLTADYTGSNQTAAQKLFNSSTNGAITLASATTYEFEGMYLVSNGAASATGMSILFAGTATLTSIAYSVVASQNATSFATLTASSMAVASVATALALPDGPLTVQYNIVRIRGAVRINSGGTFIPQMSWSATNVTPVVNKNSFFRMWAVGTNTVATVGNWS